MANRRLRYLGLVALVLVGSLQVSTVSAHELPGSTYFVAPLPEDPFTGKVVDGIMIGPPNDSQIWHTTMELTWISDGTMPAENLVIDVAIPIDGAFVHWTVTGAELGWGTEAGVYNATVGTDELNGLATWPLPGSVSIHLELYDSSGQGGVYGQFEDSAVIFEINAVTCPSDLDDDNVVNAADLAILLGAWGPAIGNPADINGDGFIDAADLALLLGSWGPCE